MPVRLTQVQLRKHVGSKALRWLELPAAHVLIRPRSSPGGTGGYFADTSAAYENQGCLDRNDQKDYPDGGGLKISISITLNPLIQLYLTNTTT